MKLNCKPGDLAIVVRCDTNPEMMGKIVTCIRPVEHFHIPGWVIEPEYFGCSGITDPCLRPIRNDPGPDESLSWCDVPKVVVA